jgi:hypothetical protein
MQFFSTEGGTFMTQQDEWQAHPFSASRKGRQHAPNMEADDSSTYVKPTYMGSAQSFSPYTYAPETAVPPPPPGIDLPLVIPSKRFSGYRIALAVLIMLVVALGSLQVVQITRYATETTGSAPRTTTRPQTVPTRTVTPGTIKVHAMLTCGMCNEPVLTTLTSITVDTAYHRLIFGVTLQNVSGAQQIDYFAEFSLQDPFGHTYEGTGNLNSDYFLDAGQTAMKTEIFSFLPSTGMSYTLVARLGISGLTYDPLQVTF